MPSFAANLSMLFTELPFEQRFAAARESGFSGVEYLFPYPWPAETLRSWLDEHGLTQVLFNLPPGDWEAGERGIACLPDRVEEFRKGVEEAVRYAEILGCQRLNCLAGLRPPDQTPEAAWRALEENVRWAAEVCERSGITLCVEAINSKVDMPGFVLDTSDRVMGLIESVGADNLKLQYDLYHMQIMEGDLIRTLERLLPFIGHIQFADNPGRHEPGTGEINFGRIFNALDQLNYRGWVSAEYHPQASTQASLEWMKESSKVQFRR
ncbi:hydroxypyruvate isomerase [Marinobacter salicampi]|uniref:hydroxypyruvate isomerase n=1 Tax=Marinobacter salicampi TaxID=435907 RepID=UPI0014078BE8|nr:hydroxypyruvate isomerase [Marinobacter salicampi]